jgi:type IV pilus assembly protein PilW
MRRLANCPISIKERGLTLVELLVALVMGLVLLAGVVTVFVANKQTYRLQDAIARLQESGRFAVLFMERDIRMAGYSYCDVSKITILANTVRAAPKSTECSPNTLSWFGADIIYGHNNVGLDAVANPVATTPAPLTGTDVLQVLVGGAQGPKVIQHKKNSAQLKVTAFADLAVDDVVLVVDSTCENGSVFQISNFQNQSINHSEVVHNKGQGSEPGNCDKDLGQSYLNGHIVRLSRAAYFVANTGRTDAAGQPIPALYRTTGAGYGPPEELVEGVEDMQILFGVGSATRDVVEYKNASQVTSANEWPQVLAVRLQLLLRSIDPSAIWQPQTVAYDLPSSTEYDPTWQNKAATDKRLRQVYSTTITIRNRAL